ncbi:MAG: hypothetical protein J6U21_05035 [Bacteroidales bacterium]|nr:hypothetical protein [Bacteroidales bacterium]
MKVKIEYTKGETTKEDLLALQGFIERQKIKGVSRVGVATQRPKKGQMGSGIVSALSALVSSATGPLSALAMALVEWVKLKRSEIRLTGTSGAELVISGKVKEKDLENAIEKFFTQEKANVKAGAKRSKPTPPPPPPAQNEEKK